MDASAHDALSNLAHMTSKKRWQWARVFIGARRQGLGRLELIRFSVACARQLGSLEPFLVALRVVPRVGPTRGRGGATWHLSPRWAPRIVGAIAVGIAFWGVFARHPEPASVKHSFEVIPYEDTTEDTTNDWLTRDAGTIIAVPMPLKRLERQQAPPCAPPPSDEVEINGACWVNLNKRLPCGQFWEHDGKCYVPVRETPKPPTSVEP